LPEPTKEAFSKADRAWSEAAQEVAAERQAKLLEALGTLSPLELTVLVANGCRTLLAPTARMKRQTWTLPGLWALEGLAEDLEMALVWGGTPPANWHPLNPKELEGMEI
jgi:hypothetical protein